MICACEDCFCMVFIPRPAEIVQNFCEQERIACLNLFPHLNPEHFFETDIHFNPQGHQHTANRLYQFLQQEFGFDENASGASGAYHAKP